MTRHLFIWPAIFAVCLYLSFNINSSHRIYTYKSPMWADNAGYYVYLPAALLYHFDASAFPKGIDSLTGDGFALRHDGRVYTKYTSGVAILQLPFFLATHLWCNITGHNADGFSQPYVSMLLISGVFYLVLGLYFLYKTLLLRYSKTSAALSILVMLAASNLYYYGLERNGMSHVYSFCLCSIALYLICSKGITKQTLLWLFPLAAFIVLIRPINIIMVLLWPLISGKSLREIVMDIRMALSWQMLLYGAGVAVIVVLPQLLYWQYLSGGAVFYSYQNEGFIYRNSPKIAEVLFSPNNGFLLYAPVAVLCMVGWAYRKGLSKLMLVALYVAVALLTYITASWWSWDFGCSYGQRNYIDYYPFFIFGLASLFTVTGQKSKTIRAAMIALCVVLSAYNLVFIYNYDDCFTYGTWNYKAWWGILIK